MFVSDPSGYREKEQAIAQDHWLDFPCLTPMLSQKPSNEFLGDLLEPQGRVMVRCLDRKGVFEHL